MSRFRTYSMALLGGALLIVLSISSAFASPPEGDGDNRGQQVSAYVHSLIFGSSDEPTEEEEEEAEESEEEEAEESEEEEADEADEETDPTSSDNHGRCVRVVAQSDAVGGPNENHGGAVSEAARVTCAEDGEEPTGGDEGASDEGAEEEGAELSDDGSSAERGRSSQAHESAPGKNKGEGAKGARGHGRGGARR